jgi:ligand-binding SRPBCC domain-containing protein
MYKLHYVQKLPISLEEAWDFFSSPANLNKITPPSLAFKIRHHHENQKMYAGQLIAYTIRPFLEYKL